MITIFSVLPCSILNFSKFPSILVLKTLISTQERPFAHTAKEEKNLAPIYSMSNYVALCAIIFLSYFFHNSGMQIVHHGWVTQQTRNKRFGKMRTKCVQRYSLYLEQSNLSKQNFCRTSCMLFDWTFARSICWPKLFALDNTKNLLCGGMDHFKIWFVCRENFWKLGKISIPPIDWLNLVISGVYGSNESVNFQGLENLWKNFHYILVTDNNCTHLI